MKRAILVACVSSAVLFSALSADTPTSEASNSAVYEYATVRWAGDRTSIIWPNGTVEKVTPFGGKKRPETADERMWYLTGALNIMARRGFEPVHVATDDIIARHMVSP